MKPSHFGSVDTVSAMAAVTRIGYHQRASFLFYVAVYVHDKTNRGSNLAGEQSVMQHWSIGFRKYKIVYRNNKSLGLSLEFCKTHTFSPCVYYVKLKRRI